MVNINHNDYVNRQSGAISRAKPFMLASEEASKILAKTLEMSFAGLLSQTGQQIDRRNRPTDRQRPKGGMSDSGIYARYPRRISAWIHYEISNPSQNQWRIVVFMPRFRGGIRKPALGQRHASVKPASSQHQACLKPTLSPQSSDPELT